MSKRCIRLAVVMAWLLGQAGAAGWAQLSGFCELQGVTVEPLPNAVVIRIKATGLLNFTLADWDLWQQEAGTTRWYLKPVTRLTLRLNNVRPGAASMEDVGIYPVSHLAFAVPPGSRDSLGLLCTLVLLRPAYLTYLQIPDNSWDDTANSRYAGPQVMILRTQAQNEALIIVTSDRPYQAPPEHYGGENRALDVRGDVERLQLQATNAELHLVAQALSARTGEPIFVDNGARCYVSASLRDMSLERMLRVLAAGYGLAVSREGGAYFLTAAFPDNPASYYASEQRRIPLRYLAAAEAPDLLAPPLLRFVHPEVSTNSVIVNGPPLLLDKVERDLAQLDQPAPHCRLRAWLIAAQARDNRVREVMARFTGGTTQATVAEGQRLSLEVADRAPSTIAAALRLLTTNQRVRIAALPSLEVVNGETAELFVGQQIYYFRLQGRRWQQLTLDSIQAGSRLLLEPRIAGQVITARISAESSALVGRNALGPLVQRHSVGGQVQLGSGRCVLIGGLTLGGDDRIADQLGLGRLLPPVFDQYHRQAEDNEVWILVEGHVRPGTASPAMTAREDRS